MSIKRVGKKDKQGFYLCRITCDECGRRYETTVGGSDRFAIRLLAMIFSGWDRDRDRDICSAHLELRA